MGFLSKIVKKIKKVFTPKLPDIPEPESGDLVNKDASDASLPIVYGERKIGGTRVYVSTGTESTANNKYLFVCLAICEGEIDSITQIQLNDVPIADADSTAYDATGQTTFTNNVTAYQIFKGTDSQAASTLLASAGTEWTSAHRLRGVAYIAFRFYWDADKFSSVPVITAVVRGRKVFNPANSTTAWSDNPVLCLRDYLTNTRYGKGLAAASIDDTSFNAAVIDCNFPVTSYTGGASIPLLTCNAILKSSTKLFENVKILLSGMRGLMPYTNGQYSIFIDRELPAGYSFFELTPNNMLSDLQVVSSSKKNRYNRAKIKFTNPETNWQPDFAIWPPAGSTEETNMLAEDGGEVMSTETEMASVTNYYRARDLARIMVLNSRASTFNLEVVGLSECIEIAVGDVVKVEQPSMGWTGAAIQYFRVISTQLMNDGEVNLSLQQYSSSTYIWATNGGVATPPTTVLPDPFAIGKPTNLSATSLAVLRSDGSLLSTIEVIWTAPANAFVDFYDVEWKKQAESAYKSNISYSTGFSITDIVKDVVYDVRVRSVNSIGAKSAFETTTSTGVGDTTAPSIPTNITLDEGVKNLTIRWTIPPQSDYQDCEVYRSTTSGGTYELVGNAIQTLTDQSLGYGATRYYKIRSVDYSGNQSAFSSVVSGTTASVGDDAFVDGVTGLFSNAGLQTIQNGNALPTGLGATDAGTLFYLTTDNKLYRWTGSAWTKAVPAVDVDGQLTNAQIQSIATAKLTGQITETQITDDAITTPKISAGAVDTAQLAAGAVIADKINAGAITAGKIFAGSVTANEIAGNTITGNKIVANTITGGLLETSGIITQSAQISNAVINAGKIDYLAVDTIRMAGNAAMVPLGASLYGHNGLSTTMNANTWYTCATTTGVPWTQSVYFTLRPSRITVIASANFLGLASNSTNHSCFMRVAAVWTTSTYPYFSYTYLPQVGGTIGVGNSMTLTLNHTFVPVDSQSGLTFQVEVYSQSYTKSIGNNGISVLASRR